MACRSHRPECILAHLFSRWRLHAFETTNGSRTSIFKRYVISVRKKNLRRKEILDFVSEDFNLYAWSLRSLDRRLEYFNIRYTDHNVDLDDIETAVRQEMDGPGKVIVYRALLRQVHDLNVRRDVVYAVMYKSSVISRRRSPKATSPHVTQAGCAPSMVTINWWDTRTVLFQLQYIVVWILAAGK